MKTFFDTEFIEDGKTIDLISIGFSREDGDELYLISSEFDASKASDWVRDNVLVHLPKEIDVPRYTRAQMKARIQGFFWDDPNPQFWAYYADYDWIALCQLFGTMMDLPSKYPKYCRDLKQVIDQLGIEPPRQVGNEHHALADARWVRQSHKFIADRLTERRMNHGTFSEFQFEM